MVLSRDLWIYDPVYLFYGEMRILDPIFFLRRNMSDVCVGGGSYAADVANR